MNIPKLRSLFRAKSAALHEARAANATLVAELRMASQNLIRAQDRIAELERRLKRYGSVDLQVEYNPKRLVRIQFMVEGELIKSCVNPPEVVEDFICSARHQLLTHLIRLK